MTLTSHTNTFNSFVCLIKAIRVLQGIRKEGCLMYYAEYCQYGINVSYKSLGGNAYDFYAFPTKAERDKWIDENEFNGTNFVAAPVPRRIVDRVMGKNFKVVDNYYFDGLSVILRANDY